MAFMVNGFDYSFTSLRISFGTLSGDMLESIDYDDKNPGGEVRDGGGFVVGATVGEYSATCSLTFRSREHYQKFVDSLSPYAYEQSFTINVMYAEDGKPMISDTIPNCRLTGSKISAKRGSEVISVSCEIEVHGIILWNGVPHRNQRTY